MNATDGRPTIGHHPRASRKVSLGAPQEPDAMLGFDEILRALHDCRDARGAVTRMLGWAFLPEDAKIGLRSARMLLDGIEEGIEAARREEFMRHNANR